MADETFDLSIEPEPDNGIITVRFRRVGVDTRETIDQLVGMVEPIVSGFAQPCYLLLDISGLQLAPRLRIYVTAGTQPLHPFVRGIAVFTHRPNPVAELLLRITTSETEIAYACCADEEAARAAIARWKAETAAGLRYLA